MLAAHHIFGRGMGGGKRNDDRAVVAILCHHHHNMGPGEHAHDSTWWSRSGKERMARHIRNIRKEKGREDY